MCRELEEELKAGEVATTALAQHIFNMGASSVQCPVTVTTSGRKNISLTLSASLHPDSYVARMKNELEELRWRKAKLETFMKDGSFLGLKHAIGRRAAKAGMDPERITIASLTVVGNAQ